MSGATSTRTRRGSECRVRSGCWKCRERRVKCPEQRPICHHCQRLGLSCHYDIRLTWRGLRKARGRAAHAVSARTLHQGWTSYDVVIGEWMFLNTTYDDFATPPPPPPPEEDAWMTTAPVQSPGLGAIVSPNASPGQGAQPDPAWSLSPSPRSASFPSVALTPASSASPSAISAQLSPASPLLQFSSPRSPPTSHHEFVGFDYSSAAAPTPHTLSPFTLSPNEARLFDYFVHFITPRCALTDNPYQEVLLRLAVFAPRSALFDCVMAVSANQMQILGHGEESAVSALRLRNRALSSLRKQVGQYESAADQQNTDADPALRASTVDQILCSAVLMCFFEISLDCLQTWKIHADFACPFLLTHVTRNPSELSGSLLFASAYFSSHQVLACTMDASRHRGDTFWSLRTLTNDTLMHTLTGCSNALVDLIAEITDLAMDPQIASMQDTPVPATPPSPKSPASFASSPALSSLVPSPSLASCADKLPPCLQERRDDIERRLHALAHIADDADDNGSAFDGYDAARSDRVEVDLYDDTSSSVSHSNSNSNSSNITTTTSPSLPWADDMQRIYEAKRLAALMYLYARVDHSGPYKPHMVRLTARIVALLPGISTRTNTILWPLFIVATLGIRPESEEERRIMLAKLEELLQTRQLGNVRKARQIIVDVWKARDLRTTDATKSWSILHGRLDTISLA
ncbi:Zn(2)-C6 fungal-type DNA-binding domain protein [Niveomyces insectorum RCEF 264]|uniref:Zn(2)-C6 fungal-type DNA-binding domain protein n=1 Tax=Niveomyces insectorum RCEF 264 TaxID=1081102 RepID=A0A162J995_9HYPO|nr:Zn(2)-C6 fungal-type DNA-binding domain protein [Niveomyces insectorum RCEF 264]